MPTPLHTAFTHRCPACGKGPLYKSLLGIVDRCEACGQSYNDADVGDGPAFFVILVVGTLVTLAAALVEIYVQPPLWVHAVVWIPFTLLSSLWLLRTFKSYLVALQLKVRRLTSGEDV